MILMFLHTCKWRFEQGGNLESSSFYRRLYINGDLKIEEELLEDSQGNVIDLANATFQSGYETGAEKLYNCIVA